MNKETITKGLVSYQSIGEQISHELGAKMIKDHHNKHGMAESYSFFIGRDIIEKTFAQPGCVGVRVYDAINEEGKKTLVTVGIDSNGKNILELPSVNRHGKIVVTEGLVWDKIRGGTDETTAPSVDDNPFTAD